MKYSSKFIICSFCLLFFCISCDTVDDITKDSESITDPLASGSKPNILLVIADDMGIEATPGYDIGSLKPNMPNLERLATNGIIFDNFWAYPVCAPTRASILTGRYGYRTGVLNAEDALTIPATEKTLQTFLDENTNKAYSHALFGKWHLSNNEPNRPMAMGIGDYAGLLGGGVNDYYNWPFTQNGQTNSYSGYITSKITDLAIDWVNTQEQPWFCWLAYTAPHTPFHLPPSEMHVQGDLATDQASIEANPTPYFMAMCESIDHELGRLLESIPEDVLENTIIIFIGDNGSHPQVVQEPFASNQSKGSLFLGGVNVPMIISGKGVARINSREKSLIGSTDLFSTIAEIAGVDLPTYQDSYSFNSLLTTAVSGMRNFNYSEILNTDNPNRSGYTISDGIYKLIQLDSGRRYLYDLQIDPYEKIDLMTGTLNASQELALQTLESKSLEIRN